jgi:hypothetical protein
MHQVIVDGLEDYLSGNPGRDFRTHLAACEDCKREVLKFAELSESFRVFEPMAAAEPLAGFATRVMSRVAEQQTASLWSIFSLEPAFIRQIAFASLLLLAALGGFLVSQDNALPISGPERLMVSESVEEGAPAAHRDRMLVRLTSYQP